MKAWYLIDDCTSKRSSMFEEKLEVSSRKEAIREMVSRWDSLSEHDKRVRDDFWVALFEVDEDGLIDFDSGEWMYDLRMLHEDRTKF